MAQGILLHAGIHPRHTPGSARVAREHQELAQRTRPSAREIFEDRALLQDPIRDVRLPAIPTKHIHPRSTRGEI